MGNNDCPECGYSGQKEVEEKNETNSYLLGFVNFQRSYGVFVCPECGYEERLRENS